MLGTDRGGVADSSLSAALEAAREGVDGTRPLLRWKAAGPDLHTLTYGEALDAMDRTRALLSQWGLRAGDRVLMATRDDGALAVLVLACLAHGAVAVVCDPEAAPREADEFVSAARPAAVFVDEGLRARWPLSSVPRRLGIAAARPKARSVLDRLLTRTSAGRAASLASYPAVLTGHDPAPAPAGVPDGDEAYVLFTSGSTGHPKGVSISRRSLLQHARTLAAVFGYGAATRLLVPLPTHHTDGLLSLILPWLCGATAVRPVGLTTSAAVDLLRAVHTEKATHLLVVPTLLSLLLDAAESTGAPPLGPPLEAVISTGAPLDERLWRTFEERFAVRVSNFYGMTETVTGGLFCGPSDDTYRRGTVGRPIDCEVRIIRPDGTVAPPDTAGELTVHGENVMLGYVGDPQATDAVLKDGWLRTGDIASRDADGFVRIVGRAKSTVIFAGHNIQPEEVSRVLEGTAGVAEAVAFGVPHPTFGEILVASVVLRPGSGTRVSDLIASCRESLAPYKVPRDIEVIDALPRGPAGKVAIPEAREGYLGRRAATRPALSEGGAGAVDADGIWRVVRETAARAFRVSQEDLSPEASPDHTPGWDSFAHLEFVIGLEDRFRIRLETADVLGIRSLGDAHRMVLERRAR